MPPNPLLGTGVFLLGGVVAALYLLPFRWVRGWRYETGWLVSVLVGWLVWPLAFDAIVAPGTLDIVRAEPALIAKTVGFGILWGIGALCWALMVRYLGVGLGLAIGAGLCAATGTLLPPIVSGRAAALVATPGARLVLCGVLLSLAGMALVGWAGKLKEGEMSAAAKLKAVAEYDFRKGLVTAVVAGIASAGINFGLQGAPSWEAAALRRGVSPIWAGMPVLTVVLWGGVITQVLWVGWKILTGLRADTPSPRPGPAVLVANFALSAVVGIAGMSQFICQKVGEPLMGTLRYVSFGILMASAIFFSTLVGALLGEWKGTSVRTRGCLSAGIAILLVAFALVSFGGK